MRSRAAIERREFELHIRHVLHRKNQAEARSWLQAGASKRSLGLLNIKQASQLVECIYSAEARAVLIVEIYEGKAGKQFSDALLVQMPKKKRLRFLIRQCLTKLPKELCAGVLPEPDERPEISVRHVWVIHSRKGVKLKVAASRFASEGVLNEYEKVNRS